MLNKVATVFLVLVIGYMVFQSGKMYGMEKIRQDMVTHHLGFYDTEKGVGFVYTPNNGARQ